MVVVADGDGGNNCGDDGGGDFLWFMISFIKSDYLKKNLLLSTD